MIKTDTIAAIATALSDSGIGMIRISGEDAILVGDRVFRTIKGNHKISSAPSHTIHYGYIVDDRENRFEKSGEIEQEGEEWKDYILDEVMVTVLKAPRSYTAEDTVEINCHGGVLMMQKILEAVLRAGARLAEPGEFTKRAFLNGRIDLSRAEAVMDVIHSQSEYALSSSVNQLKGALSGEVKDIRKEIIYEIAFIESALDDPEHISLDHYSERLEEKLKILLGRIRKLLDTADNGKLIKEGISTVIVGKPNAGKSSLLNLLVGEERAIVTDIAGTTRDILEEFIKLGGIGLRMIDTAGIRSTEDKVEKIGVERAKQYVADAELILYVVDSSVPLNENDREIFSLIGNRNAIILLNKTDLECVVTKEDLENLRREILPLREPIPVISASTKENTGIEELKTVVKKLFFGGELHSNREIVITNLRHKEALQAALQSLKLTEQSIEDGMPEDFYSIDLMSAYSSLGEIIGEEVGEDLINEIFSRFCMGK